MKISKELFEAVTGNKYGDLHFEKLLKNYDKLFFDCKKWALKQGYLLISTFGYCLIHIDDTNTNICEITSSSEQQAVFDACQWILDNKRQ